MSEGAVWGGAVRTGLAAKVLCEQRQGAGATTQIREGRNGRHFPGTMVWPEQHGCPRGTGRAGGNHRTGAQVPEVKHSRVAGEMGEREKDAHTDE